ncbi:MAG TPA: PfkB family carbohydrate kinase, partial [Pseudogracilibacillus sp.]|nr:PfkB family carbohydrate kinase [Pseudogracilibacillus sp.]
GAKGALIKQNDTIYRAEIPEVEAINPVGSGDSVLAGFAAGYSRGLRDVEWIQFGLTMGVLNAMEAKTGKINPEKIEGCMQQIKVTPIV